LHKQPAGNFAAEGFTPQRPGRVTGEKYNVKQFMVMVRIGHTRFDRSNYALRKRKISFLI
jgi:hypothetical protein